MAAPGTYWHHLAVLQWALANGCAWNENTREICLMVVPMGSKMSEWIEAQPA
jgi:hypothetical protein